MSEPLTKIQQNLRGKKVVDMTESELRTWIDACDRMENWVRAAKSRRSWTSSRREAEAELERRKRTNTT